MFNFVIQERESVKFLAIQKVMCDLIEWRRQLVTGKLTQDQTWDLKVKLATKIDWGNRQVPQLHLSLSLCHQHWEGGFIVH